MSQAEALGAPAKLRRGESAGVVALRAAPVVTELLPVLPPPPASGLPGIGKCRSASLQEERNRSGVTSTRMSSSKGSRVGRCRVDSVRGCRVR